MLYSSFHTLAQSNISNMDETNLANLSCLSYYYILIEYIVTVYGKKRLCNIQRIVHKTLYYSDAFLTSRPSGQIRTEHKAK